MDTKDFKIAVAGTGYVGPSIATLLSQHHQVMVAGVPGSTHMNKNRRVTTHQIILNSIFFSIRL